MAKSKKKDYIVHIEMDRDELANVLQASCMYASAMKEGILMDCSKGGFMLSSVEFHSAAALVIAVSKKYSKDFTYDITDTNTYLRFDPEDLKKLVTFYKGTGEKNNVGTMTIREKWITCKIGNVTKRIQREGDPTACVKSTVLESFQGFYNGLREVGEFETSELLSVIKGFSSIKKGAEGFFITFKETKKVFEIIRDLGNDEDISADMTALIMDRTEKNLSATYSVHELHNGIKYVSKLSETIILTGDTKKPMIFTHHGTEPNKGREFPEQSEFWYSIAPVFIEE